MEDGETVSFAEAARRLGCSRQNVYQQAMKGRIPCERNEKGQPCVPVEWIDKRLGSLGNGRED